jgi:hypothetical protein
MKTEWADSLQTAAEAAGGIANAHGPQWCRTAAAALQRATGGRRWHVVDFAAIGLDTTTTIHGIYTFGLGSTIGGAVGDRDGVVLVNVAGATASIFRQAVERRLFVAAETMTALSQLWVTVIAAHEASHAYARAGLEAQSNFRPATIDELRAELPEMAARIAADGPSAEAHGPEFVRASLHITSRLAYWQPWADWRLGARFWRETFDDLVDDDLAEFGPAPPAALRAALADELLQSATLDLGRVLARPAPAAFTDLFTTPAGAPAATSRSRNADH